ncbi:MAG: hypothetical protein RBU27_05280, partial [Bacteroidota bacterium]|nr:hypothetical protein [Bacteroidota bacterium]
MEIPSTFERHRRYRLRRQRMQRLRRRTAVAMTAVSILFVAWHLLARLGPEPIAPPSPASLGSDAARSIARRTVASVNRVHAELYPGHREDAKRQVLRLLSPRS